MVKDGTKWIMKTLTDTYSQQENGTVHSYNYFENNDGLFIYNITFHHDHGFAPVQIELDKKIPIKSAIIKARKIYNNTRYV